MKIQARKLAKKALLKAPAPRGWNTSDEDEIQMRQFRAATELMDIQALDNALEEVSRFRKILRAIEGFSGVQIVTFAILSNLSEFMKALNRPPGTSAATLTPDTLLTGNSTPAPPSSPR